MFGCLISLIVAYIIHPIFEKGATTAKLKQFFLMECKFYFEKSQILENNGEV